MLWLCGTWYLGQVQFVYGLYICIYVCEYMPIHGVCACACMFSTKGLAAAGHPSQRIREVWVEVAQEIMTTYL